MADESISVDELDISTDVAHICHYYYGTFFILRKGEWYLFNMKTLRFEKCDYQFVHSIRLGGALRRCEITSMVKDIKAYIQQVNENDKK